MLSEVIDIVRQASALMSSGNFKIMQKDGFANLVTSSDFAVQHFLTEKLSALLPGSGFLCEEEDAGIVNKSSNDYVWIIDPIDGTANYSRGMADCCISVALSKGGILQLGVVYSPARGQLFSAEKGRGAFCNGERIHVSSRPYEDSIFCTAMCAYYKEFAKTCSEIIYDIYMQINDSRRFGSAAIEICLLAAGMIELYFEIRLQPWDYAAAMLILSEAGGYVSGFDGASPSIRKPSMVIAANTASSLHRVQEVVHRHLQSLPY